MWAAIHGGHKPAPSIELPSVATLGSIKYLISKDDKLQHII